jgi:hypothetical protein
LPVCILLGMKISPSALLYAALALSVTCTAGIGSYAGFQLGGRLGSLAGAVVAAVGILAAVRITLALAGLRVAATVRAVLGDGHAQGTADTVLTGITLYEAAAFPLIDGGTSAQERQARRTVAYRLAACDGLPRPVRVAAAAALEVIDAGLDRNEARDAVNELAILIYGLRSGRPAADAYGDELR